MTEDTTEKTEYNELRHSAARRWFKPVGSEIQQTVPVEPVKALQIDEEQLVRLENAFLHPFHAINAIQQILIAQNTFLDEIVKDNLIKRQSHDDFAQLGLTLNYRLAYHRHTYVYAYSAIGFTLATSNGYAQVVPANYWTLVNYPEGTMFTVSGGSDTAPILCQFRSCDVPLEPANLQVTIPSGVVVSGTVAATQSGTWTTGATSDYPAGATPALGTSGNVANAAANATLTGVAGQFTWVTGFEVTGSGATVGLPVTVTLTNTIGGTASWTYAGVAGVLLENTPLIIPFPKPVRSFSQGQSMVLSVPALGAGNTNSTAVIHGYTL